MTPTRFGVSLGLVALLGALWATVPTGTWYSTTANLDMTISSNSDGTYTVSYTAYNSNGTIAEQTSRPGLNETQADWYYDRAHNEDGSLKDDWRDENS